jgi:hypothetical protein
MAHAQAHPVLGYNATGDGRVDAFDANHDGRLDAVVASASPLLTPERGRRTASTGDAESLILEHSYDPNYEPQHKDILEYAVWLGMDPEADRALLWIAERGVLETYTKPLPKGWDLCQARVFCIVVQHQRSIVTVAIVGLARHRPASNTTSTRILASRDGTTRTTSSTRVCTGVRPLPAPKCTGVRPLPAPKCTGVRPLPAPKCTGVRPLPAPKCTGVRPLPPTSSLALACANTTSRDL